MTKKNSALAIQPLSRVLVKPMEHESRTASGIILPETAKEKPQTGVVVVIGGGPTGAFILDVRQPEDMERVSHPRLDAHPAGRTGGADGRTAARPGNCGHASFGQPPGQTHQFPITSS